MYFSFFWVPEFGDDTGMKTPLDQSPDTSHLLDLIDDINKSS